MFYLSAWCNFDKAQSVILYVVAMPFLPHDAMLARYML